MLLKKQFIIRVLGKFTPAKFPPRKFPPIKLLPGKFPFRKILTQKIPTWNIPTYFLNCLFSLNTASINGGRVYMYILLPVRKILISPGRLRVFSWKFGSINKIFIKNNFSTLSICASSYLLLRLKSPSARGASHHPAFMGNCRTISHTFYSLIYPVDEFSLKETRTWGQFKISSYYFFYLVWIKFIASA